MASPTVLDLIARAAETTASTTSATGTATGTAAANAKDNRPPIYHAVGIILAISSGLFIGVSFVIKKVGLLKANAKYKEEAGEGYGYLKNAWWWLGMSLMIVGEICNFVAYAFVDAILVTPMGSLSVVVTTVLSAIFLKERLSFVGKVGCFQCIIGSVIIVLNAPAESAVADIQEMQSYVITPGFLTYAGVILVGSTIIALWAGPRYGKKSMLVYISICSMVGGLSVVATQGLGAAIVAQIGGEPQFKHWFLYILFVFVLGTLATEIVFLNKALNIFNAALVTPTYYVCFTSATIITSAILFQGFKGTVQTITTIVLGFLVICSGVVLLQLSKSAKDVPDTAVFKGDLDQVRTMGEQEEHVSEPQADAIRGGAAIMRTFSKARLRKEADEVKRIHEDQLEPIGENEEVEWDGIRRRKTVVRPGTAATGGSTSTSISRRKTVHPPLGMSSFPSPSLDWENESHDPAEDTGILPNFRRRATQAFGRKTSAASTNIGPKDTIRPHTVALSTIPSATDAERTHGGDLSDAQPHIYGLPDDLKRGQSIGLSGMHAQDTSYTSPGIHNSTLSWAPQPSRHLTPPPSSHTPGPTPPAHSSNNKRQFSFLWGNKPSSGSSADGAERPTSARTMSSERSFPRRVFSGFGGRGGGGGKTEEERLGLVTGDSANVNASVGRGRRKTDGVDEDEDDQEEKVEAYSDTERPRGLVSRKKRGGREVLEDEYDDAAFSSTPERISSEESGYAKVHRRGRVRRGSDDFDDDDYDYEGGGSLAKGASFV